MEVPLAARTSLTELWNDGIVSLECDGVQANKCGQQVNFLFTKAQNA